jgi:hypothetical protein
MDQGAQVGSGTERLSRRGVETGLGRVVFGLLLLTMGALFFLDEANLVESEPFWRYWPAAIILFGVAKMLSPGGRVFGAFVSLLGLGFLLDTLNVWEFEWSLVFPAILVFAGATLLWRGLRLRLPGTTRPDDSTVTHAFAMLGGSVHRVTSQDFRGGDATALLGGVEMDLTRADLKGEAVIDAFAMWGGVEIKVPDTWTVILQGTPILGAVEDSRRNTKSDPAKRLVIRGTAIMGGVEVKN